MAASSSSATTVGESPVRVRQGNRARHLRQSRANLPKPPLVRLALPVAPQPPPMPNACLSCLAPDPIRRPRSAAAHTRDRIIEILRCLHTLGCYTNHALGAP